MDSPLSGSKLGGGVGKGKTFVAGTGSVETLHTKSLYLQKRALERGQNCTSPNRKLL